MHGNVMESLPLPFPSQSVYPVLEMSETNETLARLPLALRDKRYGDAIAVLEEALLLKPDPSQEDLLAECYFRSHLLLRDKDPHAARAACAKAGRR